MQRSNVYQIIVAAGLLMGILFLGCALATTLDNETLRFYLAYWTVLGCDLSLFLLLCGIVLDWPLLSDVFLSLQANTKKGLLFLLALSLFFVVAISPRTNRLFYDEHIYQSIAQHLTWTNQAFLPFEAAAENGRYRPINVEYNKQPNGHPWYLARFFRLFGTNETVAHAANNFAYLLSLVSIFGLSLLMFRCQRGALFATGFLAFTPIYLIWSNTTAAEIPATSFAVLMLFSSALYVKHPSIATVLLVAGSAGLGVQMRPESLLLLIPALLFILLARPQELFCSRFYWLVVLICIVCLPEILHLYSVSFERWGSSGEKFSLSYFKENFFVNSSLFVRDRRYPILFFVLAVTGLCLGKSLIAQLTCLIWFLLMFSIFLFFYAGSYEYGADVRFAILPSPPLALLAGAGASWFSQKNRFGITPPRLTLLLVLLLGLTFSKFFPALRAVGYESIESRDDVKMARELVKDVLDDAMVLSHNPSIWLLHGKNSAQLNSLTNRKAHIDQDMFVRYTGGVYFHWNYWCNVPNPVQNALCSLALESYDTVPIQEYRVRGKRYALYRLYQKPK